MAARKRIWTPEIVRERIRTSMLLNRLHNHIVDPAKTPMTKTQVSAATFLLSRVVGQKTDAQDVNLNGNVTVLMDDPTQRPEGLNGYHRKPIAAD
jgi:hypothetical protein